MTFNKSMYAWLLAIFLTLIPGVGLAQFENGSLIGTIRDASGAVIAGAQVIVVNTGTGISVSTTTDKDGDYELPSVHIGTYTISATHEGFNKAIAENISISVNTRQRVDLTLHVGMVGETVEVTNVQLALETESSQRGQIITQYQTEAFPLSTLNYSDLVGLATGVTVSPIGTNNGNQSLVREGSFNVSGQRSMFNNYILDGVDNNAHGTSNQGFSNQIMQPAPTSVAEFQVVTNNSSAEYGRASGVTINVAFASGTNKFHGQVYEYFRNTVLNGGGYFPGRHSLKAGVEYQHIRVIDQDVNPIYGRFTYNAGTSSSTCLSCNNMLDFLFGATAKYEQTSFFVAHLRQNMYFGYLQDDWKISNRLTLNLGMRYEYGSRFSDKDNLLTNFDPVTTPVTGKMLSASPGGVYNRTLIDPDLNDFAPRLGFAFAATPTTVLHGGYGVSFVHTNRDGENDVLAVNAPQTIFGLVQQVPAKPKGTAIKPTANYRTLDQGFASDFTSNFNIATTTITYVPRNYRDAYVQSYYLSVQRQLGANRILDIAYVGNHSLKLMNIGNFNQRNVNMGRGADGLFIRPYPAVGDIIYTYPGGYGNYNGLQVRYEQRKVHDLTVLNSFTYSRAFDNAAGNLENSFGNNPVRRISTIRVRTTVPRSTTSR